MILTCLDHLYLRLSQLPLDHCPYHNLDHPLHLVHFLDFDHHLGWEERLILKMVDLHLFLMVSHHQ
jgi:hypothetical protein